MRKQSKIYGREKISNLCTGIFHGKVSDTNVDDLMPWSAKFKDFVAQNVHLDEKIPENEEKPKGKLKRKCRVA